MSGLLGDLSPAQEETLQIFRREVEDIPNKPQTDDYYYLRWLRARKFDINASLEMFRNHMKWRIENDVDTIFEWTPPEVLDKYLTGGFLGEDKEGHPVFYDFLGNLDVKGVYRSCKSEDGYRLKVFHAELGNKLLREKSEKYGRNIETITAVCDMENLSYQRQYHWPAIQLIKKSFIMFSENYPERTKAIFIINAPRLFPVVYNIFKHFMDESTRNRLHVLGANWKEVLQNHISLDQLPQAYGGTRCEPDPQCTDYLRWGGEVPERYYLTNLTETKKDDMDKVVVGRGSTHQTEVFVDTAGSIIKWEFVTSDYDIRFGVFHKSSNDKEKLHASEMTPVVPTRRRNSHVIPVSGVHQCEEMGTYVLRFDNTYSWMRSKEVFYTVGLEKSDPSVCQPDVLTDAPCLGDQEDYDDDEFEDCTEEISDMGLEPSVSLEGERDVVKDSDQD